MDQIIYIAGQALSILAMILGFISFQMKSAKGILVFQILASLAFSAHYFLIGAMTAMALNFLGAIKCFFFYLRAKKGSKNLAIPIFFTVLVVVTSLLTWDGWISSIIMVALVINSIALALSNPQVTRACMYIKSPMCLVYNLLVGSVGGVIYECSVLVSSTIGILRNRKTGKES